MGNTVDLADALLSLLNLSFAFMMVFLAVSLIITIILVVALWKIFVKACEPGWKCLIPIYNAYTLCKIAWGPAGFLLMVIPVALIILLPSILSEGFLLLIIIFLLSILSLVVSILFNYKLAKAFGHGIGYMFGLIFLPVIFYPILGFGSDYYLGPQ